MPLLSHRLPRHVPRVQRILEIGQSPLVIDSLEVRQKERALHAVCVEQGTHHREVRIEPVVIRERDSRGCSAGKCPGSAPPRRFLLPCSPRVARAAAVPPDPVALPAAPPAAPLAPARLCWVLATSDCPTLVSAGTRAGRARLRSTASDRRKQKEPGWRGGPSDFRARANRSRRVSLVRLGIAELDSADRMHDNLCRMRRSTQPLACELARFDSGALPDT